MRVACPTAKHVQISSVAHNVLSLTTSHQIALPVSPAQITAEYAPIRLHVPHVTRDTSSKTMHAQHTVAHRSTLSAPAVSTTNAYHACLGSI